MAGFVTFEGIDGTGKSTCIRAVADALVAEGHSVWCTREETDSDLGAAVRTSIAAGAPPLVTTFLFLADRARHVEEVRARTEAGDLVLCDRFLHSTLAYQGVTLEGHLPDPEGFLRLLHVPWCPVPDHVVLLTASPRTCIERTTARGEAVTRYEKAKFLADVQARYLRLAEADPDRFTVLDAERVPGDVAADALAAVRAAISPSRGASP